MESQQSMEYSSQLIISCFKLYNIQVEALTAEKIKKKILGLDSNESFLSWFKKVLQNFDQNFQQGNSQIQKLQELATTLKTIYETVKSYFAQPQLRHQYFSDDQLFTLASSSAIIASKSLISHVIFLGLGKLKPVIKDLIIEKIYELAKNRLEGKKTLCQSSIFKTPSNESQSINFSKENFVNSVKAMIQNIVPKLIENRDQTNIQSLEDYLKTLYQCYWKIKKTLSDKCEDNFLRQNLEKLLFSLKFSAESKQEFISRATEIIKNNFHAKGYTQKFLSQKASLMATQLYINRCEGFDRQAEILEDNFNLFSENVDYQSILQQINKKKINSNSFYVQLNETKSEPNKQYGQQTGSKDKSQMPKSSEQLFEEEFFETQQQGPKRPASVPTFELEEIFSEEQIQLKQNLKEELTIIKKRIGLINCPETAFLELKISCLQRSPRSSKIKQKYLDLENALQLFGFIDNNKMELKEILDLDQNERIQRIQSWQREVIQLNCKKIGENISEIASSDGAKIVENAQVNIIVGLEGSQRQIVAMILSNIGVKYDSKRQKFEPKDPSQLFEKKLNLSKNFIDSYNIYECKVQSGKNKRVTVVNVDSSILETSQSLESLIINNFIMTHYLQKSKSVRFLIVISQEDTRSPEGQNLKALIKQISSYFKVLSKAHNLEDWVSIILTKGLTISYFHKYCQQLKRKQKFIDSLARSNTNNVDIFKSFINLAKQKENCYEANIENQQKQNLLNKILQTTEGKIKVSEVYKSTFHPSTNDKIKNFSVIFTKLINRSIELLNPGLVDYYYEDLDYLQSANISVVGLIGQMKKNFVNLLQKKVNFLDQTISDCLANQLFLDLLETIKNINNFFHNEKLLKMYPSLFCDLNQKNPVQLLSDLYAQKVNQVKHKLQNQFSMNENEKKKVSALLTILKEIAPRQYQSIQKEIKSKNQRKQEQLDEVLKSDFDQITLRQVWDQYSNRFLLDKKILQNFDQIELEKKVKKQVYPSFEQFRSLTKAINLQNRLSSEYQSRKKAYLLKNKALVKMCCLNQEIEKIGKEIKKFLINYAGAQEALIVKSITKNSDLSIYQENIEQELLSLQQLGAQAQLEGYFKKQKDTLKTLESIANQRLGEIQNFIKSRSQFEVQNCTQLQQTIKSLNSIKILISQRIQLHSKLQNQNQDSDDMEIQNKNFSMLDDYKEILEKIDSQIQNTQQQISKFNPQKKKQSKSQIIHFHLAHLVFLELISKQDKLKIADSNLLKDSNYRQLKKEFTTKTGYIQSLSFETQEDFQKLPKCLGSLRQLKQFLFCNDEQTSQFEFLNNLKQIFDNNQAEENAIKKCYQKVTEEYKNQSWIEELSSQYYSLPIDSDRYDSRVNDIVQYACMHLIRQSLEQKFEFYRDEPHKQKQFQKENRVDWIKRRLSLLLKTYNDGFQNQETISQDNQAQCFEFVFFADCMEQIQQKIKQNRFFDQIQSRSAEFNNLNKLTRTRDYWKRILKKYQSNLQQSLKNVWQMYSKRKQSQKLNLMNFVQCLQNRASFTQREKQIIKNILNKIVQYIILPNTIQLSQEDPSDSQMIDQNLQSILSSNHSSIKQITNEIILIKKIQTICNQKNFAFEFNQKKLEKSIKALFQKILSQSKKIKGSDFQKDRSSKCLMDAEKLLVQSEQLRSLYLEFLKENNQGVSFTSQYNLKVNKFRNQLNQFKEYQNLERFPPNKIKELFSNSDLSDKNAIKEIIIAAETENINKIKQIANYSQAIKEKDQFKSKILQYPADIQIILKKQLQLLQNYLIQKKQTSKEQKDKLKNSQNYQEIISKLEQFISSNDTEGITMCTDKIKQCQQKLKSEITFDNLLAETARSLKFIEEVWRDYRWQYKFKDQLVLIQLRNESLSKLISHYSKAFNNLFNRFIKRSSQSFQRSLISLTSEQRSHCNKLLDLLKIASSCCSLRQMNSHKQVDDIMEKQKDELSRSVSFLKKHFSQTNLFLEISEIKKHLLQSLIRASLLEQFYTENKNFQNGVQQYKSFVQNIKNTIKEKQKEINEWNLSKFVEKCMNQNLNSKEEYEKYQFNVKLVSQFSKPFQIQTNCNFLMLKKDKNLEFRQMKQLAEKDIQTLRDSSHLLNSTHYKKFHHLAKLVQNLRDSQYLDKNFMLDEIKQLRNLLRIFIKTVQEKINQFSAVTNFNTIKKYVMQISDEENRFKTSLEKFRKEKEAEKLIALQSIQTIYKTKISSIPKSDSQMQAQYQTQCKDAKQVKNIDFQLEIERYKTEKQAQKNQNVTESQNFLKNCIRECLSKHLILYRFIQSEFSFEQEVLGQFASPNQLAVGIFNKLGDFKQMVIQKFYETLQSTQQKSEKDYALRLIDELQIFSSIRNLKFLKATMSRTFDVILNEFESPKISDQMKRQLRDYYNNFDSNFNVFLTDYNKSTNRQSSLKNLIEQTIDFGKKLSPQYHKNTEIKSEQKLHLLSKIFVLWTILKSKQQKSLDTTQTYCYMPNSGQVLAIFLLLNLSNHSKVSLFPKSMIQVSTGEGKSVILGILSAYLSLVGFRVYEACFSSYLSQRDYNQFFILFSELKITENIKYGIFRQICDQMLKDDSTRQRFNQKVQKFLTGPKDNILKKAKNKIESVFKSFFQKNEKNPSILLIDEADIFLDPQYLGQTYRSSINIGGPSAKFLFQDIWQMRNDPDLSTKKIIQLKSFQGVCETIQNPIFKEIMQNQTHAMIRALKNYEQVRFQIRDKKLFYKEQDSLSSSAHYGYRTIWRYFKSKNDLDFTQFERKMYINLIVASFSYKKLPEYFRSILGVTGTLEAMSECKKNLLQNQFHIENLFKLPSIFPKSNRQISVYQCHQKDFNDKICLDIQAKIKSNRPVILFFPNKSSLTSFYNSPQFRPFNQSKLASIVTFEDSPKDRDTRIENATLSGRITLFTTEFQRGTDFKVMLNDEELNSSKKNLGLHVISTFLPKSYSDYIQLIGRTGRKGNKGSVSIFYTLNKEADNYFQMRVISIKEAENQIKINERLSESYEQYIKSIRQADKEHDKYIELYKNKDDINSVLESIKELNYEMPIYGSFSKTVIGLDGTISMGRAFHEVKKFLGEALPIAINILKERKINASFEIKLAIYRNYNSFPQSLLQFSQFHTKHQQLTRWLQSKKISGGWGNQAIEVLLQHANRLPCATQCIIIGDSRANTEDQVLVKRQNFKQALIINGFQETTFEKQLNTFIKKKGKVHSYYVATRSNKSSVQFFKDISKRANGLSQEFNVNDQNATLNLSNFLVKRIYEDLNLSQKEFNAAFTDFRNQIVQNQRIRHL